MTEETEIKKILNYIGMDDDNPNMGTKAKRNLFTKVLGFCITERDGNYNNWVSRLSMRFNMSTRTIKENYIEPLIDVGILDRDNNKVRYLGVPNTKPETLEELDKAVKEAKEKRKKE